MRQGKTAEETSSLIKQSMILSKTGAMTASEATQYLTSKNLFCSVYWKQYIVNSFNCWKLLRAS